MLDCRRCNNWVDEPFAQLIEENRNGHSADSVFYQCKVFGFLESFQRPECPHYAESAELYAICSTCGIAVPKVCISLGECVNCTDTELICVEECRGEGEKKYCTHYQRLLREGHTLIENNECFEIFPQPQAGPAAKEIPAVPILTILPEKDPPTNK